MKTPLKTRVRAFLIRHQGWAYTSTEIGRALGAHRRSVDHAVWSLISDLKSPIVRTPEGDFTAMVTIKGRS